MKFSRDARGLLLLFSSLVSRRLRDKQGRGDARIDCCLFLQTCHFGASSMAGRCKGGDLLLGEEERGGEGAIGDHRYMVYYCPYLFVVFATNWLPLSRSEWVPLHTYTHR